MAVSLALDQVILGAAAHRFDRRRLIVQACYDNDRQVRGGLANTRQRLEAMGVRQREIEKNQIERFFSQ